MRDPFVGVLDYVGALLGSEINRIAVLGTICGFKHQTLSASLLHREPRKTLSPERIPYTCLTEYARSTQWSHVATKMGRRGKMDALCTISYSVHKEVRTYDLKVQMDLLDHCITVA